MNLFKLAYKNLMNKPQTSSLCVLLLTLGIGLVSFIMVLNQKLEEKFIKNIEGIDMVVGAKGSPLQIILAAVYHIDAPTGNIKLSDFYKIAENPMVKTAIPMSLGDNHQGFRIVGTNKAYIKHFNAEIAEGQVFTRPMDVVLGVNVAADLSYKIGSEFAGNHGLDAHGEKHDDAHFVVKGILKPTGTVIDQLILTPYESMWAMHHSEEADSLKEITAALLKFRNKMGVVMLPRQINAQANLQAAVPAPEINRLMAMMGLGFKTLKYLAFIIMFVAGLSVLVSLYNQLKDHKYEMALMLSMGASRFQLFIMLLLEALMLCGFALVLGFIFSRLGLLLASGAISEKYHYSLANILFTKNEILLVPITLFIGFLAAALPSINIYKINISKTLSEE